MAVKIKRENEERLRIEYDGECKDYRLKQANYGSFDSFQEALKMTFERPFGGDETLTIERSARGINAYECRFSIPKVRPLTERLELLKPDEKAIILDRLDKRAKLLIDLTLAQERDNPRKLVSMW
jgi:hypothetical protein